MTYCIVPRELAPKLHETLRRFFRDDPSVEVIVERRAGERRSGERRAGERAEAKGRRAGAGRARERRAIRNAEGRRMGERRASQVPLAPRGLPFDPAKLPRRARAHADRLAFVQRLEPGDEHAEDLDSARLVTRFQAGDREAFAALYLRYFDRVYNYLRLLLNNPQEAEDAAQQAFTQALEALPAYERRSQPFRAWLFVVVRNYAVDRLRKEGRIEVLDPDEINRRREEAGVEETDLAPLNWISDRDLLVLVERLPLAQRQVLLMRYMLDLSTREIAAVMRRRPNEVSVLQYRALGFLKDRLTALGRDPATGGRRPGMRRWGKTAPVLRARRWSLPSR